MLALHRGFHGGTAAVPGTGAAVEGTDSPGI